MSEPIRAALVAAIHQARPGTSEHWTNIISSTAMMRVQAELRWLDIYEAAVPEKQAGKDAPCRSC